MKIDLEYIQKITNMNFDLPTKQHTPITRKWTNTAGREEKTNKTNVLPVVLVRDPYTWMQSLVSTLLLRYRLLPISFLTSVVIRHDVSLLWY